MESQFTKLRLELIDLGYTQTLKPDCVPLVDRLLSDLKTTTESLQKYMNIAQQAIEERDNLLLGAEPYKCDNAKLIRECNELHLAFIQFKEQHEKVQRELKTKIVSLQSQLENCELEKQDCNKQIKDLEVQLSKIEKKGIRVASSRSQPSVSKSEGSHKSFQLNTAMACADQKIAYLSNEIRKLKEEHLNLVQSNELFKNQLHNRDQEIERLKNLLEGGRPLEAISKDCCYKNIDNKIGALRDEISSLKREKNTLHNQLKDALAKQHEAMRRALHLAERNKVLENEMKDIDQIALAVEAECNSTIRSNVEKVTRLQDRMNESVIIIQNLERENHKLKQDKQELSADLDAIKLEKKHLQSLLDTEIEDKKRLTDRINSFSIIEHDLNMEIDRLVRITGEQKRKIAELECQVTEEKLKTSFELQKPLHVPDYSQGEPLKMASVSKKPGLSDKTQKGKQTIKKPEHKITCKKFTTKRRSSISKDVNDGKKSPPLIGYESQIGRCCCESDGCVKHMKELLDKEMEYRQTQAVQQIESLKQEKEYYMKEYHRVCDQMRNVPTHDKPAELQGHLQQLMKEISEKNKTISDLQNEIQTLSKEKYTLRTKFEALKGQSDSDMDGICEKTACKRQRRELEIIRNEFKHLESENDSLKSKVQSLNESMVFDQERMKRAFQEMEEHIRKLENERRDLVIGQTTSRSTQAQFEEEYNQLKEQLRATQIELNNQKANYNQLKGLHEQADRALSDAQNQVLRTETELATLKSKLNSTHRESDAHEREVARLQSDIQYMKTQLSKIDKEKDNLLNVVDEKTEKIALLEDQLREKKNTISSLEMELKELKRKLGNFSDESATQQQELRSLKQELALLQREYDNEKKLKESALQENRRLQNDVASVSCDCKEARKQLDLEQRQVDDLKRQLQHYVAEVKRTEDLISQKELERTEILDQFKCLSEEANLLESSNHTLENEATQSRVQLSVALDHASDLERKIDNQDAVIRSYEKQITELTSQVASLEIQLKQSNSQYDRITTELQQMKDLCVKLDHERDNLKRDIHESEGQRGTVERNIDFHVRQNEELKKALDKERNNLDGVEKLLKEARQDIIEQRLLNQDLQSEVTKLKAKVDELQERLATTSEQLDLYQEKALEYSQQNKQLRREVANERFFRAREDETKRIPRKPVKLQDTKSTIVSKKSCYKFCNKDKCPAFNVSKIANTKVLPVLDQNENPPSSRHSSYYEFCNKSSTVHKKPNNQQTTHVEEHGSIKKIYPILKKSQEKDQGRKRPKCVCSCGQCRYKHKVDKGTSQSDDESKTSLSNGGRRGLLLKHSWSQVRCHRTSLQSNKKKLESTSSSTDVLSISSHSTVQSTKRVSTGSFKNKLTVEMPGMECCISSNKTIKSKLSPCHRP